MKILIDADGCPVVTQTVEAAARAHLSCIILCDTAHQIERQGAKTIVVEKGADSVDFHIVELLCSGDIVVTQDYGLAAMCLAKKAVPLTQNGLVISDENVDQLLFTRYLSKKMRNAGVRLKGPAKRSAEQDKAFVLALQKLLAQRQS